MKRAIIAALLALATSIVRGEPAVVLPEGPGVILAEESAGVVTVDTETRLLISGFSGKIVLRASGTRELRFMSSALADPKKKLRVRLRLDEGTFLLEPLDAASGAGRIVEVLVPEQLRAEIHADDTRVGVTALRSGVEVVGARLEVDARGIFGGAKFDLETSRLQADTIDGDLTVRGKAIEGRIARVSRSTVLEVAASGLELVTIGSLDGDLADTKAVVNGASGWVRLRASGGRVELTAVNQGGELRLSRTPFFLQKSKGDFEIESDAEVRFLDTVASLHINGFGPTVRGSGNQGLIEVRMDGGVVSLERIAGPARVQGERLEVTLTNITGEVFTDLQDSTLVVDTPSGPVTIVADSGTTTVNNASREVSIRANGGAIKVNDLRSSIDIDADVETVEVHWAIPFPSKDSSVKNDGGRVEMRFPSNAGLQMSAETRYGRIESTLPGLKVEDRATTAKGQVGRGNSNTTVRIQAGGDIVLGTR